MAVPRTRPRVIIENVRPAIDCGRFPIKRVIGEPVVVEAGVFADGHDELRVVLLYRKEGDATWAGAAMQPLGNDAWQGRFTVREVGLYHFTIQAEIDAFATWRRDLGKRLKVGQDVSLELHIGAGLLAQAAARAAGMDRDKLRGAASFLTGAAPVAERARRALEEDLAHVAGLHPDMRHATTYEPELNVWVDRMRARYSTWYELFPRSCAPTAGLHGTLRDVAALLPRLAALGFDVLYVPPIHSIGRQFRKGKNNNVVAQPDDVGSPWAIGGPEGGHKSIHPLLGTFEDFQFLRAHTHDHGIEIALDIAFQCSPDHPWVREHPSWFRHRPDGTIQYAENPPKKYQDIYPLDFETADWEALWDELRSVFLFWIDKGVRIFRVDNPHTKAFGFWEWCIGTLREKHPDVLFLSEAFTRPKVMYRLAKLGFTQSYTYFTWRNTKQELTEYFTELTRPPVSDFFRPNLWPNTPDILHDYLQRGGRPAFVIRLVLAATLGASYGIYGPAYETCTNLPREAGSEEYLYSEKYEIKRWELDRPDGLASLLTLVNRARRDNPALQANDGLVFHSADGDHLLCYSKSTSAGDNQILVVINLDPQQRHWGFVQLALDKLGLGERASYTVHDLLTGAKYSWHGARNYVDLDPQKMPAHVFRIER